MTHPLFRKEIFVETAFERRFQALLLTAMYQRSWHVIVADPGAGKSMGIRDMARTVGSPAVLAATAPKNNEEESALGNQLSSALGLPLRGHWNNRKPRLMRHLYELGTKLLIIDDAHDLSLEHLMFLKELTDQGRLQFDHPLGLCLVAAGRGNTIPLKEILDQPDATWVQFRRRLDKLEPFCRIANHTSEEVREILAALEKVYRDLIPQLNLHRWSGAIYTWLTVPVLDPAHSGRATMDYLMKLVTTALEWTYEAGESDVQLETLEKAASLLILRRDTLRIIDGEGPRIEEPLSEVAQPEDGRESEPQSEVTRPSRRSKATRCSFSEIIPIDLEQFQASGVALVECPACGATRTLQPQRGILHFAAHDQRKTAPTVQRWACVDSDWAVVGG